MTHPTFDTMPSWLHFDVPSSDPYLRETLFQFAHCQINPDFEVEKAELDAELSSLEMVDRLRSALTADDDELRVRAAKRLVSTFDPDAESILLRFLNSDYFFDRMSLAPFGKLFHSDAVVNKVIELATADVDPDVRAEACRGLRGQDLRIAIPILLRVMHEDGADIDPLSATTPPDAMAAFVLDELLGTSFMEIRLGNGYSTFPPGGCQPEALEKKAKEVLRELQDQVG